MLKLAPSVFSARVFIAEDETLIAWALADISKVLGCSVAGSVSSVNDGLAFKEECDLAILDINLIDGTIEPVGEKFAALNIPFILTRGNSDPTISDRYPDRPLLEKPFLLGDVQDAMVRCLGPRTVSEVR